MTAMIRAVGCFCMVLVMLAVQTACAGEDQGKVAGAALKAMSEKWQRISKNGFADVDEARGVMGDYANDKAALDKLAKDAGSLKAELDAAGSAQKAFDAYIEKTKGELDQKLTQWAKTAPMMAKRWDMVSQQALDNGTNVPQGMIDIYKKSTNLSESKKEVGIYTAIAGDKDDKAKEFNEKLDYVEKVGVKMGAVDSAVTPRDSYADGDKADLKGKIEKLWKETYPKDEVIGVRFIDEKWTRKTEKRYNNVLGWYLLDFSSLEVRVVVKQDKDVADIYPVYLTKDHLKKDELEIDVETAKSAPAFKSQMLLKNYKP
ncbi:MAG: hypothetical protein JXR97_00400 [Planctomycetes bacterium]|nr:hypothetical protein [Planctomycetota bacterium]